MPYNVNPIHKRRIVMNNWIQGSYPKTIMSRAWVESHVRGSSAVTSGEHAKSASFKHMISQKHNSLGFIFLADGLLC